MTEVQSPHLERLLGLTEKDLRQPILQQILDQGWDAGCWLRAPEDHLVLSGSLEQLAILDATDAKTFSGALPTGDPHMDGLPESPIDGVDACWVVVTQQCDLLRDFKYEPFAELARATLRSPPPIDPKLAERGGPKAEKRRAGNAKQLADWIRSLWRASARLAPLSPEIGEVGQWVVDLRARVLMPKDLLVHYQALQAIPANAPPYFCRDRFRRRLSDRYSRAAVPDKYLSVVRWLKEISKEGPGNTMVREWVLRPPVSPARAELHAIGRTQHELDAAEFDGERWVTELSDVMPDEVSQLIEPDIRWAPADVFPVATWDGAWRLDDLEALSWLDPGANPLPPTR
jgi:hypothetical protein